MDYCNVPTTYNSQNKIIVSDDEFSITESIDSEESSLDDSNDNSADVDENEDEDDEIEITEITREYEYEENNMVNIEMDDSQMKHIDLFCNNIKEPEDITIVVSKLEVPSSPIPFLEEGHENVNEIFELSTNDQTSHSLNANNKPKKTKQSRSNNEDTDISDSLEDFNGDYSKLNVTQLRKIVTDRGLSTHSTKLKKTELLQLLSNLGSGSSVGIVELGEIDSV